MKDFFKIFASIFKWVDEWFRNREFSKKIRFIKWREHVEDKRKVRNKRATASKPKLRKKTKS